MRLIAAVASSVLILVFAFAKWTIVEWATPFLMWLLSVAPWLAFLVSFLAGLTCLANYEFPGLKAFMPMGIHLAAAAIPRDTRTDRLFREGLRAFD